MVSIRSFEDFEEKRNGKLKQDPKWEKENGVKSNHYRKYKILQV
jgi:hypothetical protein